MGLKLIMSDLVDEKCKPGLDKISELAAIALAYAWLFVVFQLWLLEASVLTQTAACASSICACKPSWSEFLVTTSTVMATGHSTLG